MHMVRAARIELASPAWKAGIIAFIPRPRPTFVKNILPKTRRRRKNKLHFVQRFDVSSQTIEPIGQLFIATVNRINILQN